MSIDERCPGNGDAEGKEPDRFNPFVKQRDKLAEGQRLELREVYDRYLKPELEQLGRKRKSIFAIERNIRLFELWWQEEFERWQGNADLEFTRPIVANLTLQHLTAYQAWLTDAGRIPLYVNASVRAIRQILRCAEKHGLLTHAPRVNALPARIAAPKLYLIDDYLDSLWHYAPELRWPRKRRGFRPLHYSAGMAWRACLVLWVTYGFRTQELIALEEESKPITWAAIHLQEETPNPAGSARNKWGWIEFTPPKQSWVKGDPLYLPLTLHARAAIEHLRPVDWKPEDAICDWTLSSSSFYQTWHKWTSLAAVRSKTGDPITPKHLRKTCATRILNWRPGVAPYITGHAKDRSGRDLVASSITAKHYENSERAVLECLTTIPLPPSFKEILRPPSRNS